MEIKKLWLAFLLGCLINLQVFADTKGYPCDKAGVMELTDRGTLTDTPCIVPPDQFLVEGGYQYQRLITNDKLQVYPSAQVVYGLPGKSEVFVDIPNYNQPTDTLATGFGAVFVGAKHEFAYGATWAASLSGILTLPSGSDNFGSPRFGEAINLMLTKSILPQIALAGMLGSSRIVDPAAAGGQSFISLNPSISILYNPFEMSTLFIEVFGQTKTAFAEQSGFFISTGVIYQIHEMVTADIEVSHIIAGNFTNINSFVGAGVTVLL